MPGAIAEARRAVRELGAVAVIGNPNPINGRHVHDPAFEPPVELFNPRENRKYQVPGPLKIPSWLPETAAYQEWSRIRDSRN